MADPDHPRREGPGRGGLFRRLAGGNKGAAAQAFSAVEELFGPTKREARIVVEEQRRIGRPAPSPTDPPTGTLIADPDDPRRFAGEIVINAEDVAPPP